MILIFSRCDDGSTTQVINYLNMMGEEVIRINTDEDIYKFKYISSKNICFINTKTKQKHNLLEATSCWWRRTGIGKRSFYNNRNSFNKTGFEFTSLSQSIINAESHALIKYIFTIIYSNTKINLGSPKRFVLNKLLVLGLAQKHGMLTPTFEIVSNTSQINLKNRRIINKPIEDALYNVIENNRFYSYTEEISAPIKQNVNIFPSLIMELIEKDIEIRTFYLNGVFYSMAIFSQTSKQTSVDFRKYNMTKPNRTEPFKLPLKIEKKLHLVFKELNLNTGSVDIILDKQGNYYFLEINPIGQYGMVSIPCNYNLDYLIAKYLKDGKIK